jgi:hypothetical protein
MQYMKLDNPQREELLAQLGAMAQYLRASFDGLSPGEARRRGPAGTFAPVEQVWHLADLEREGFGERIRRLLAETNPLLADFDGTRVAAERAYLTLPLEAGLAAFESARTRNLTTLRALPDDAWSRSGTQEGVGTVSLCDMPAFLLQHDSAHRAEIEAWRRERANGGAE